MRYVQIAGGKIMIGKAKNLIWAVGLMSCLLMKPERHGKKEKRFTDSDEQALEKNSGAFCCVILKNVQKLRNKNIQMVSLYKLI